MQATIIVRPVKQVSILQIWLFTQGFHIGSFTLSKFWLASKVDLEI